jgi:hypothetical protein
VKKTLIFLTEAYSCIVYALYLLKKSDKAVIAKMLADDIIGRQAITEKDTASFGLEDDKILLLYEGSEEANKRLAELFKENLTPVEKAKAEAVYKLIKDEESRAEGGMGFLFG